MEPKSRSTQSVLGANTTETNFLGPGYTDMSHNVKKERARLTRKDAEQGDPVAQWQLGDLYAAGRGVPKDYTEAIKWYRLSANQGNACAQCSLAFAYKWGQGVPKGLRRSLQVVSPCRGTG